MNSTTHLHGVESIEVKPARELGDSMGYVRDIIVRDEEGNCFILTMFGDRAKDLVIEHTV